jgi:hypothetical protein
MSKAEVLVGIQSYRCLVRRADARVASAERGVQAAAASLVRALRKETGCQMRLQSCGMWPTLAVALVKPLKALPGYREQI